MNHHLIQRQVLDIRLRDKARAVQQQEALRVLYWEQIVPALEDVFSTYADVDTVIQIDKLELDLGSVPYAKIKEVVVAQAKAQVAELVRQLPAKTTLDTSEQQQMKIAEQSILVRAFAQNVSQKEALFFFLKTGLLPWHFYKKDALKPKALLAEVVKKDARSVLDFIKENHQNKRIQKRWLNQFSVADLLLILKQKSSKQAVIIVQLERDLLQVTSWMQQHLSEWTILLPKALKISILETIADTRTTAHLAPFFIPKILQEISKLATTSLTWMNFVELINKEIVQQKNSDLQYAEIYQALAKQASKNGIDLPANKGINKKEISNEWKEKERSISSSTEHQIARQQLEEGIFIENVGIVLVAPFLGLFFENIGLVKQGAFIDEAAQERAVLLLHYLATGETSVPESELLLYKILCHWDIEKPVADSIEPSEKEQYECNDLLQSVIDHWGALGDVTPASLQDGFLRRGGKLIYEEGESPKVMVERISIDTLLSNLPWSISVIRLPWMRKSMIVEW